jgi:hypothetical protein
VKVTFVQTSKLNENWKEKTPIPPPRLLLPASSQAKKDSKAENNKKP